MAQQSPAPIGATREIRAVIALIALWSFGLGLALLALDGSNKGALSAGIDNIAGRRLVGVLVLVMMPVNVLILLRPYRYGTLLWLPFCAQAAIGFSVAYSILRGDSSFADGFLAMVVSGGLAAFLGFTWVSLLRSNALAQYAETKDDEEDSGDERRKA